MSSLFNPDLKDFLQALNKCEVDYILVGGYAIILQGYERVTADMDIWVKCTPENYSKIVRTFHVCGMPVFDMTLTNFIALEKWDIFRFGKKPVAIDIMTKVKGLDFEDAFIKSESRIVDAIPVRLLNYHHLIFAKRQAGRSKDLNDIENLPQ